MKLLVGAHVDAFAEFFHLTQADLDDGGLGTDDHVMDLLQHNLCVWEDARMAGDAATALRARQRLADIFEERQCPRNNLYQRQRALEAAQAGCPPSLCAEAMGELAAQLIVHGQWFKTAQQATTKKETKRRYSCLSIWNRSLALTHFASLSRSLATPAILFITFI